MQSNYLEVIQDADLIHLIHQVVAEKQFTSRNHCDTRTNTFTIRSFLRYLDDQSANDYQVLGIAYDLTRVRQLEKCKRFCIKRVS